MKLLSLMIIAFFIASCAHSPKTEFSKDKAPDSPVIIPTSSTQEISKIDEKTAENTEPNLDEIGETGGVENFIKKETGENWILSDGNKAILTEKSQQKLISQLLAEGKKQFDLGYKAQVSKHAENISELNVVKTIRENDGKKEIRKTYIGGKSDKQIRAALANTETAALNVCRSAGKLELSDGQSLIEINCPANARRILQTINKSASRKADGIMQPLYNDKFKDEKPDL